MQGSEEVEPGTAVEVALAGTAGPLEWDGSSLTYKYSYTDENGQTHEVWLANAAALANRTSLADGLNLGGISVNGLGEVADGAGYAAALNSYLTNGEKPAPESAAIVWTVRDGNDSVVASATGEELTFAWDGSEDAGDYTIGADFALGETIIPIGSATIAVGDAVEEIAEEPVEEETEETGPSSCKTQTAAQDAGQTESARIARASVDCREFPGSPQRTERDCLEGRIWLRVAQSRISQWQCGLRHVPGRFDLFGRNGWLRRRDISRRIRSNTK